MRELCKRGALGQAHRSSLGCGVRRGCGDIPRHPSQLYEACLEGIVLFAVLYLLSRRKKTPPQGSIMGTFVLGYGIVRF